MASETLRALWLYKLKMLTALLLGAALVVVAGAALMQMASALEPPDTPAKRGDGSQAQAAEAGKPATRIVLNSFLEVEGRRRMLLISVDPATGKWRKLTEGQADHPRVSPDGQTVLFHRDDAIWNCDTAGSDNPGKIATYAAAKVDGVGSPVWSPDGKHFYLSTFAVKLGEIYIGETWRYEADGSNPVKQKVPLTEEVLDISADAKRILTMRTIYSLTDRVMHGFHYSQVRLMALDGSDSRPLSDASGVHTEARLAPDGRRVVYPRIEFKKGQSIVVAGSNGQERLKIYSEPGTCIQGCCWSPDGKQVAAVLYDWDGQGDLVRTSSHWRLEVMDADGHNRREVPLQNKVHMLWPPDWHVLAGR